MTAPNILPFSPGAPASGSPSTNVHSSSTNRSDSNSGFAELGEGEESFEQFLGNVVPPAETPPPEATPQDLLGNLGPAPFALTAEPTTDLAEEHLQAISASDAAATPGVSENPLQSLDSQTSQTNLGIHQHIAQTSLVSPESESIAPAAAETNDSVELAGLASPSSSTTSGHAVFSDSRGRDSFSHASAAAATPAVTQAQSEETATASLAIDPNAVPEIVATPLAVNPATATDSAISSDATSALQDNTANQASAAPLTSEQAAASTASPAAEAQDATAQSAAAATGAMLPARPSNSAGTSTDDLTNEADMDHLDLAASEGAPQDTGVSQRISATSQASAENDGSFGSESNLPATGFDLSSTNSIALESDAQSFEPPIAAATEITAVESGSPAAPQTNPNPTASTNSSSNSPTVQELTSAAIADQVVSEVRTTLESDQRNVSSIEMRLDPPELGRLTIRIEHSAQGLVANITASEDAAFQLLSQDTDQLMQNLEDAGLEFTDFQLSHQSAEDRQQAGPQLEEEEGLLGLDDTPTGQAPSANSGSSLINVLA